MTNLTANITIGLNDKASGPARKISQSLKKIGLSTGYLKDVGKSVGNVTKNLKNTTREAGILAGKLAVLGGAGLWFVKSQLVDTAAEFEKFKTVLETLEGSSAKAKISMDWVSDFAAKTPFELDQVMDSFVKLKSYGLDPTKGLLESLGDTASAMGKPIIQAVEAIADAITGENERLKEFGITSETRGNQARYSYTDKSGAQRYKIVDKNNRKIIQSTLMAIWNEKYGGAMEKQSKTWSGMISNLADQWTRFKLTIMDAGLFDWMKNKLSGFLDKINSMAKDGSLQKLAADIGTKLKNGFVLAWQAGKALIDALTPLGKAIDALAKALGGYDKLAIAVASLMAGKFLLSVVNLAASFVTLGTTAIPGVVTALTKLAPILTSVAGTAGGLASSLAVILPGLAAVGGVAGLGMLSNYLGNKADSYHMRNSSTAHLLRERENLLSLSPNIPGIPPIPDKRIDDINAELQRRQFEGKLEITVSTDGGVKVNKLQSSPGFDIDVDSGMMMHGH